MTDRGELDALWERDSSPRGWKFSDDQLAWFNEIVERTLARGQVPVWSKVHTRFKEKWPDNYPKSKNTIAEKLRSMIEDAQRG